MDNEPPGIIQEIILHPNQGVIFHTNGIKQSFTAENLEEVITAAYEANTIEVLTSVDSKGGLNIIRASPEFKTQMNKHTPAYFPFENGGRMYEMFWGKNFLQAMNTRLLVYKMHIASNFTLIETHK